jgi:hypothetical protein
VCVYRYIKYIVILVCISTIKYIPYYVTKAKSDNKKSLLLFTIITWLNLWDLLLSDGRSNLHCNYTAVR